MSNKNRRIESIPCEGIGRITHIDVEVYYSKDRFPRGYYLRVAPVKREGGLVSCDLFSVVTKFLLETNRFSEKQFEKAVTLGRSEAPALVEQVIQREKSA